MTEKQKKLALGALFALICVPALYQIYLLVAAVSHRIGYPYDLEWMEGGLLVHAQRIRDGLGIYGPPTVDFIPYLYTPLYPTILALFGPSYTLGRAISALSLVAIAVVTIASLAARRHGHRSHVPAIAGGVLALGLFCAAYPVTKGWYDLVRADTFFLYAVTAAIAGLSRWSTSSTGLAGHAKVGAGAAILALAFFAKQTGIIYVAFGGAIVLVLNWRRVFAYVGVAGAIGLGFTALFGATTQHWFWFYVSKVHRAHDFNMVRFKGGPGRILGQYPLVPIVIGIGLAITIATWVIKKKFPKQAQPLLLWTAAYAVSILVGALGIATEWSVENAFMPAFLHGAIAAGAAVPAIYACAQLLAEHFATRLPPPVARALPVTCTALAAAALALTAWTARWNWRAWVPTDGDVAAGGKLVERIAAYDGRVWFPSHPWYVRLAGKTPYVHRMGVKDVTDRQPENKVTGALDALDHQAFSAIVLDNIDIHDDGQPLLEDLRARLRRDYHAQLLLPAEERPRGYAGSPVVPESIWVPTTPPRPPAGATLVFDFEDARVPGPPPQWQATGWTRSGGAWGNGPVGDQLDDRHVVVAGYTGHRFAASTTGDNQATGRLTSPPFAITGGKLTLSLGGGLDATKLRVELVVDGQIVGIAGVPSPGGEQLRPATIDTSGQKGKQGTLVLVDDATNQHLLVDDVMISD